MKYNKIYFYTLVFLLLLVIIIVDKISTYYLLQLSGTNKDDYLTSRNNLRTFRYIAFILTIIYIIILNFGGKRIL